MTGSTTGAVLSALYRANLRIVKRAAVRRNCPLVMGDNRISVDGTSLRESLEKRNGEPL